MSAAKKCSRPWNRSCRKTDLYFIDYDDRLSSTQIDSILAGDDGEAYDEYIGNVDGDAHAIEAAKQAFSEAEGAGRTDITWDDLGMDEQQRFIDLAGDRDDSTPLKDLIRNTSNQLLRTRLGVPSDDPALSDACMGHNIYGVSESEHTRALEQKRYDAIGGLLRQHGIDPDAGENRTAIEELVNEGPYDWHEGVELDVIFYSGVDQAAARHEGSTELSFSNPNILLIDRFNGSGHDVRLEGSVAKTIPATLGAGEPESRAFMDEGGLPGYGWDRTACVVKSYYTTEIQRTEVQEPEVAGEEA